MSFFIGNVEIKNKICIAPMAGITNKTFRKICESMGAGLVVTEMISAEALVRDNKKTIDMIEIEDSNIPVSVQLFGSEVSTMVSASKFLCENFPPLKIIDINMGCPVPKVAIKNNAGSNLLRYPDKVYEIVKGITEAVSVPVTVKIRLGWDEKSINACEIAKICERAGASAIFVHGRTRSAGYSGKANLEEIKKVVECVSIPVIGNGDITSCYDAKKMLDETKCAAVMIGRGVLGNPWLIKECIAYLDEGKIPEEVSIKDKTEMMKYHTRELIKDKNETTGVLEMRSQLMYYLKGLPNTKEIKLKICSAKTEEELLNIIEDYLKYIEENYA